ncbi:ABC transporter ATP-binding protein [Caulobacter radicis]|uniref:peptidase domain-containing ABC transporter n=1 Tax=Caulobacter radicis TaxID=2172650 RepID=UPI000D576415|nr:peptidase domain-containing ABC transporter [Caulobacter radicis]PVM86764.1 ABC transporter ATP-binding protein [Caulobacter radicis]
MNWRAGRLQRLRQVEAAECGLVAIAYASASLGQEFDIAELRRRHPVSTRGLTLKEVVEIASGLDLTARAVRCELDAVKRLTTPAILHWKLNHFVVLTRVSGRRFYIFDPARGESCHTQEEFSKAYTGVAVEISRAPTFNKRRAKPALSALSLVDWTSGLTSSLVQALIISSVLQIYVVISPLFLKFAIDAAAVRGDIELLSVLAVGFAAFAIFNTGAELMRNVALQRISSTLNWDMSLRVFHQLVRLPLPWFQRRKLSDTLARIEGLAPIREAITNGLVGTLIDSALSVITLGFMLFLSWKLTLVTLLGVALYAMVRLIAIPISMRQSAEVITASVGEQGKRIETLRAIQTIKAMSAEVEREIDWSNRLSRLIRAERSSAIWTQGFASAQKLIDALVIIATIFIGVKGIIENEVSSGLLFAFLAYRTQFSARCQSLFEQAVNWRLLDLHTSRIADIALQPREDGIDKPLVGATISDAAIEAQNIGFSYADHERPVFENLSFRIPAGSFAAIVGPSGAGKSTLIKCLCGLYPLSRGQVLIDDVPMDAIGGRNLRRASGIVLQDDELLSGSIADNVAFFDENVDGARIWQCLGAAGIEDEIKKMPMQLESLIGDMGVALSGGQKQRILLARALYRRPKILFLDEATSHLDLARERLVNQALKELSITRIVIAHRPETIAMADMLIKLKDPAARSNTVPAGAETVATGSQVAQSLA